MLLVSDLFFCPPIKRLIHFLLVTVLYWDQLNRVLPGQCEWVKGY